MPIRVGPVGLAIPVGPRVTTGATAQTGTRDTGTVGVETATVPGPPTITTTTTATIPRPSSLQPQAAVAAKAKAKIQPLSSLAQSRRLPNVR